MDIPNSLDDIWGIDIKKQSATIPLMIRKRLTKAVDDAMDISVRKSEEAQSYLDMLIEEIENNVPFQQIYIDKSQNVIDEEVTDERKADVECKAEVMIKFAVSAGATDIIGLIDRLFMSEPFSNFLELREVLRERYHG